MGKYSNCVCLPEGVEMALTIAPASPEGGGNWWEGEQVIPLKKVRDLHPRKIHLATIQRWCLKGLLVKSRRVRLQSWKEGGERFTTVEAYRRFVAKQN